MIIVGRYGVHLYSRVMQCLIVSELIIQWKRQRLLPLAVGLSFEPPPPYCRDRWTYHDGWPAHLDLHRDQNPMSKSRESSIPGIPIFSPAFCNIPSSTLFNVIRRKVRTCREYLCARGRFSSPQTSDPTDEPDSEPAHHSEDSNPSRRWWPCPQSEDLSPNLLPDHDSRKSWYARMHKWWVFPYPSRKNKRKVIRIGGVEKLNPSFAVISTRTSVQS